MSGSLTRVNAHMPLMHEKLEWRSTEVNPYHREQAMQRPLLQSWSVCIQVDTVLVSRGSHSHRHVWQPAEAEKVCMLPECTCLPGWVRSSCKESQNLETY